AFSTARCSCPVRSRNSVCLLLRSSIRSWTISAALFDRPQQAPAGRFDAALGRRRRRLLLDGPGEGHLERLVPRVGEQTGGAGKAEVAPEEVGGRCCRPAQPLEVERDLDQRRRQRYPVPVVLLPALRRGAVGLVGVL